MYREGKASYLCGKYRERRVCKPNRHKRVKLEQDVTAFLFQLIRSEDLYDRVQSQQDREQLVEHEQEIDRLEKLCSGLVERKRRLFDLYESKAITREEFIERKQQHAEESQTCEQALAHKRQRLAGLKSAEIDRKTFRQVLESLEQRWDECDVLEKKHKLAALIEKIVVKDGAFKIQFRTGH